jgi:glycosyltransferase involved in cell wall biosynthesis
MIDSTNPDYLNTPASPARPAFDYFPTNLHESPCVSIVTPFFNSDATFHETALSVMRQSLQQWEWIIINDGSTDPVSKIVLQSYRQSDDRIRLIDLPENRGPSAARNIGVRQARADYVVFLDSDDLLETTALEKLLWFLESRPECSFVSGYSVGFGATHYLWSDGFHNGREILNRNTVRVTAAIRKAVPEIVGGFKEDLRRGLEDWHFWLRCAEMGYWGDTIPEYLDWYRRRKDHADRWENYGLNEKHQLASTELQSQYAHLMQSFPTLTLKPLEIYPRVPEEIPFKNLLQKKKHRLLMLIPWMTMGGADKFNLDLLSQLSARNWEITIVATLPGDNCWFPEFARITPDIFILDNFLTLVDWPRFICYLIDSRRIDHVLISNSDFGYSILPYLKQRFPEVVYTDFCHMEEEYWKAGGYPRKAVENQPLLDMNIVSSEHLKQWMLDRNADPERISVCYTNIDSTEWQPLPENKPVIRRELDIPQDIPLILYAGRLHPQKQPRVFAETMLRLKNAGLYFITLVAGDGPEYQWLRHFLIEHNLLSNVRLLGALPNTQLKRVLQGCDIFFLPSRMEGISLAVYEAMACGVVVVGADVGGQKELVSPTCGYLVERASEFTEAETYSAIISDLLNNPVRLRSMGTASRQRIVTSFELNNMGRRMHELLLLAKDWNRNTPRLTVNPGLGQSLVSMAVDYYRIDKLLRDVWPFHVWTQRNRTHLEILFPFDKLPLPSRPAALNSVQSRPDHSAEEYGLAAQQGLEESIYNFFAYLPEGVLQAYLGSEVPPQSPLLQDLIAIRRRILPEIERWRQQKLRIAIYGIGTHTQALLGTIPAVMPLVSCFIDSRANGPYLGKPCIKPASVRPDSIDVVVYSSKRWEHDMFQNLSHLNSIEHMRFYETHFEKSFQSVR